MVYGLSPLASVHGKPGGSTSKIPNRIGWYCFYNTQFYFPCSLTSALPESNLPINVLMQNSASESTCWESWPKTLLQLQIYGQTSKGEICNFNEHQRRCWYNRAKNHTLRNTAFSKPKTWMSYNLVLQRENIWNAVTGLHILAFNLQEKGSMES